MSRERRIRIRTLLALLVLGAAVPLGLFGGWLILRSGQHQREVVDRQNVETARAIAVSVDKTVESTIDALRSLAALDLYQELAPERFARVAARVLRAQPTWHALFVTDPSGRDLADTTHGFGDLDARRAWARTVSERGRPAVSDLSRDPASGVYYVTVGVPIPQPEGAHLVLGARILAHTFSELLRKQTPPPEGVVTLIDGQRRIIARTRNEERYVGGPPSAGFLSASGQMSEGSWRETLLEGTPAHGALSRAPRSGWTVGVGLPTEGIDAPIRRSLAELTAAGSFVLAATLLSAFAFGRLMFRSFEHAADAARALALGAPVTPRRSRVAELDQLSQELGKAAVVLEGVLEKERAARTEAEAANRSKDEFVAIVSHELRTPLSAISGWVQLLQSGALDEAERARAIEVIARNTRLQAQLINDLLDLSRMVTGTLSVELRPVDVAIVLAAAVDAVRPEAARKGVALFVAPASAPALVDGDPDRLQQIAWNLLTNAIKFTDAGGRIDVALEHEGKELVLRVRDSGAGIAAALLPHVFERFRQGVSSASRSQGGLGIGLALVQHLVDLHGGRVEAMSEGPGRGACFTVRLPSRDAHALAGAAVPAAPAGLATQALRGVRVLVVDDEADARELVATVLAHARAEVVQAASVAEALEQLAKGWTDVLVSDVAMPGETGHDLIERIRRSGASLPAIALSAYGRVEDRERALRAGFDLHLVKPVDAWSLVQAVAGLVNRSVPPSPASP